MKQIERWGVWETSLTGPAQGNPFVEQQLYVQVDGEQESRRVEGFYDGDGVYRARFMPAFEGAYHWRAESSWGGRAEGCFVAGPPRAGNHGPVYVADQVHFAYADGTAYHPWGTTCYAWAHQPLSVRRTTLETLQSSCFNKVRYCVFPKHYNFNFQDPEDFPYEGVPCPCEGMTEFNFENWKADHPQNHWDFTRFRPEYFRRLERCVEALTALGVQSDLILFHPYDRWGFSLMTQQQDDLYLRYVLARLSAYRAVWWSLANEYDLMRKDERRWEQLAQRVVDSDPYRRLRSIHNCFRLYDFSRPWVTHASIQRTQVYQCAEFTDQWREQFRKPVVIDENAYEGNLPLCWGNISGQETARRFWETTLRGGYATHGETLLNDSGLLWWSHGGRLYGESEERIRFLARLLEELRCPRLKRHGLHYEELCAVPDEETQQPRLYLLYYGISRPSWRDFDMGAGTFRVTVIDTWNMTRQTIGSWEHAFRVPLSGREYMAVLLERV
ncbi:MAG: DUF5060 domain-containing protein [Eubacteriales bacterium]|nr:DUF5060 domain-containing protein [Eubacteriales bacterium]